MFDIYNNPSQEEAKELFKRPAIDTSDMAAIVGDVFEAVRKEGDKALADFTERFDKVRPENIRVSQKEIDQAIARIDPKLRESIRTAFANIEKFHLSQRCNEPSVETTPGIECWRKAVGIEKVGLYVPGGSAPLFSTVLMLAVPAKIAGCKEVVLCSPPNKEGKLADEILFAASLAGVTQIFKAGGIQAIAAMTFGTQSIPAVYKIFGPGNQYVTAAKQMAQNFGVAIDLPAGPSEVLVVADESTNPDFVASDLLGQMEHGGDSQAVLLTTSRKLAEDTRTSMERIIQKLSRRQILEKSLRNVRAIVTSDKESMMALINEYAAEHLILSVEKPDDYLPRIINAGSVFVGHYTPESLGDYASGTNHTLPTGGWAKSTSGVSLDSFVKKITFQRAAKDGLCRLGGDVQCMANAEGLDAHANAVGVRLDSLKKDGFTCPAEGKSVRVKGIENIFIRENIRNLAPYSCARDEFQGVAKVMIDANESPYDRSEKGFNRYPDPYQKELKEKIAQIKGVKTDNLLLGNGSDECIDILFRTFCRPGLDNVIVCPPTYGMYKVSAAINDVAVKAVPLVAETFALDIEGVLAALDLNTRIIWLCSPNNPTGNALPLSDIEKIASGFDGMVVVDEAYIDFSSEKSALTLLEKYSNIAILQTFSKAWGLANLRLGMLFADPQFTRVFSKVKPPYNINGATQSFALEQLAHSDYVSDKIREVLDSRKELALSLAKLAVVQKVYPSDANFLLVKFCGGQRVFEALLDAGIVTRNRNREINCGDCIRITVGTPDENAELLRVLGSLSC